MAGNQPIGVLPAGQPLDPLQPCGDVGMVRPGDPELVGPVQISAHREVGDGRTLEQSEPPLLEMAVEDAERIWGG